MNNAIKCFEKNGHRICWGDALAVLNGKITSESVDLIFVDPPYNIGKKFSKFVDKWSSDKEYIDWCKKCNSGCL